jgi:hypothetical protein
VSVRLCACGCKRSLEGKHPSAKYASDAHRAAHWKETTGYTKPSRENGENGTQNETKKPSGLQVSYRKAVIAVARVISETEGRYDDDGWKRRPGGNVLLAEDALLCALSARQRAQLQANQAKRKTA